MRFLSLALCTLCLCGCFSSNKPINPADDDGKTAYDRRDVSHSFLFSNSTKTVWVYYPSEVDEYNSAPLRLYSLRSIPWDEILARKEAVKIRVSNRDFTALKRYIETKILPRIKDDGGEYVPGGDPGGWADARITLFPDKKSQEDYQKGQMK